MTVDLYLRDAASAEAVVTAWLTPLGNTATKRRAGDSLPQRLVKEVTSTEYERMTAYPVVSVHVLGRDEAEVISEAKAMHRRMLILIDDPLTAVTLTDSSVVTVEWAETVERPHWQFYSDAILQKVARYRIALPFT